MDFDPGGLETLSNVQAGGALEQKASLGDTLGAAAISGIHDMPIMRINNALSHVVKSHEGETLSPQDANDRYGINGILHFDTPVSTPLADSLYQEKRNAYLRDATIRNGPSGIASGVLTMAAGAIPSFLDPINIAATMVPGVGEARLSTALGMGAAKAEGLGLTRVADGLLNTEGLNRVAQSSIERSTMGHMLQGASQGMAGQAALEPLTMYLDRDEHNDWTMGQTLTNIAFGGIMGGAFHGGAYALSRRTAARELSTQKERRAPQETLRPDEDHPAPSLPSKADPLPDSITQAPPTPEDEPPRSSTIVAHPRLDHVNANVRGQVLTEGIASLLHDRPSNAQNVLQLNEIEQARRDLSRLIERHDRAVSRERSDMPLSQNRAAIKQDLTEIHQQHSVLTQQEPENDFHPSSNTDTPKVATSKVRQPKPKEKNHSLFTFLIKHGGVRDEGGDLRANDIHKQRIGLVRRKGGLSLDRARERAEEAGYLKPGSDINALLNAMVDESHGRKQYFLGDIPHVDDASFAEADREEHERSLAQSDIDHLADERGIRLTKDTHRHATESMLQGHSLNESLDNALKASSHDSWEQYAALFDKGHVAHKQRLNAQKEALHSLTEHTLGRYSHANDAGVFADDLPNMARELLSSENPQEAIETALTAIESKSGKGFDPSWSRNIHTSYQQYLHLLAGLEEDASNDILRSLQGHESREIAESRAGLSAQKEAAPISERGASSSPLPTSGIEHLNLSDVGPNPELVGHMMDGIEGVPAWPVVLGDKDKARQPYLKDGKIIYYATGRLHIQERHGHQLQVMGYESPAEYVRHILKNANEVRYDTKSDSYFVVVKGEKKSGSSKHDAAVIELKKEDGYYRVKTAAPFKLGYLRNKILLQEERRTIPSDRIGHDHPLIKDSDHMSDGQNPEATAGAEEVSTTDYRKIFGESQDESFTQAQNYGVQLDQHIALHGDAAIPPDELDAIKREHALSDGNANALFSAMSCLIRNGK